LAARLEFRIVLESTDQHQREEANYNRKGGKGEEQNMEHLMKAKRRAACEE
jgi:hypothetical protein